jgi:hypothetical protein
MNMSKLRIKKRKKKFKVADLPIELKHVNLDAAGIDWAQIATWSRYQSVVMKYRCASLVLSLLTSRRWLTG